MIRIASAMMNREMIKPAMFIASSPERSQVYGHAYYITNFMESQSVS